MQQLLFDNAISEEVWFRKEGCNYHIVDNERKAKRLSEILETYSVIAYDVETDGINIQNSKIVGVSFCGEPGLGFYIPLKHKFGNNLDETIFKKYIAKYLEKKDILGHNLKFDYKFTLKDFNINIRCKHDTLVIAKLLDIFDSCKLKHLGKTIFDFNVVELGDILVKYNIKYNKVSMLKPEELYEYCCQDTDLTLRIFEYFKETGWEPNYMYNVEVDLIYPLAKMELRGVRVCYKKLVSLKKEYKEKADEIYNKIKKLLGAGDNFNINSGEQFGELILARFPDMKRYFSYTQTRSICFDDYHINKYKIRFADLLSNYGLSEDDNIFELYSKRKKLYSLLTKYIIPWLKIIEDSKSEIIYTNFNSLGAGTGRMSSNDPNFQNVTESMRYAIMPRKGYYFLSMDYDQMEYRILVGMAKLSHLYDSVNCGEDVHKVAASLLFDTPLDEVTKQQRKISKTCNFGILYGMGEHKLADTLNIKVEKARELIKNHKERFLGNTKWFDRVIKFAEENGYILTAFGRKRRLDNIKLVVMPDDDDELASEKRKLYFADVRKAINTPIQGTSADIMKIALRNVDEKLRTSDMDIRPILVIHDELICEVSTKYEVEKAVGLLRPLLEFKKFKEAVDLTVDYNYSYSSWGDIK